MKTLRENDGCYDVPWEFVSRQGFVEGGVISTTGTANNANSTTMTNGTNGAVACSRVSQQANNRSSLGHNGQQQHSTSAAMTSGGVQEAQTSKSATNGIIKKDNNTLKKTPPPIVAPKPTNLNHIHATNGDSSSTTACIFNKMTGDSSNGVVGGSSMASTPPCGIRAQRLRKERYTSSGGGGGGGSTPVGTVSSSPALSKNATTEQGTSSTTMDELSNCVVWEYRKPEHDARPPCEYDAPWDCKRLSQVNEQPTIVAAATSTSSCQCPTTEGIERQDDAIYDEPWDTSKNADTIKKAVLGLSFRSAGAVGSNSPSTRSTRSSGSRTSDGSTSDGTMDQQRLDAARRSAAAAGASSILSQDQPPSAAPIASSNREQKKARTPVHILETAFCSSRASPITAASSSTTSILGVGIVGGKKQRCYQDKDKLIQQLCSGDPVVSSSSPVRHTPSRRSVNTRHSAAAELMNKERRATTTLASATTSAPMDEEAASGQQQPRTGTVSRRTINENNDENHQQQRRSTVKSATEFVESSQQTAPPPPDYDTPWEFSNSPETARIVRDLQQNAAQPASPKSISAINNSLSTTKLEPKTSTISSSSSSGSSGFGSKLNRQHLSLNFGCTALNPTVVKIDTSLPLNTQMWYHGNITRAEAEQRLSKASEGSFLVRVCESSMRHGDEYALSLKSAKGYMHMKIQQDPQRMWILGYFSQPFDSIPTMIKYYSVNKLPIKGAEHMRLLRPVADQVL